MTIADLVPRCEAALRSDGLYGLLRTVNTTTPYRFTGIYRFDGEWVKSVWLYDRAQPDVRHGSDVRWDASYCRITATDGGACEIANSLADARLRTHAAREVVQSYIAVVLRRIDFSAFGTLCHYDIEPRVAPRHTLDGLRAVTTLVERALRAEFERSGRVWAPADPVHRTRAR